MKKRPTHPSGTVGILALQGSFAEHAAMLQAMSVPTKFIRSLEDATGVTACIIPGGESTTMMQLLESTSLDKWLIQKAKAGMPLYGTCAGMIVLANLGLIDIQLNRNAYGPQLYSFETSLQPPLLSCRAKPRHLDQMPPRAKLGRHDIIGIFIRAPRVTKAGPQVRTLIKHGKDPVMLQQNNILVSSFHPELTQDTRVHKYFSKMKVVLN